MQPRRKESYSWHLMIPKKVIKIVKIFCKFYHLEKDSKRLVFVEHKTVITQHWLWELQTKSSRHFYDSLNSVMTLWDKKTRFHSAGLQPKV